MVAPAVEAPVAIGLDVGGTKILSGLVDRDGLILVQHEAPSPGLTGAGLVAFEALDGTR
jgi:predicted NBD/HSP70 family sugar kinase